MSFAPRFSITNPITAALTRIERARGFLDAAKLSDEWVAAMRSRAFLLEAHHTTHIEGTRLSLEQAEQLLAGRAAHRRPDPRNPQAPRGGRAGWSRRAGGISARAELRRELHLR